MDPQAHALLRSEAISSLQRFCTSNIPGYLMKGIDRARMLGLSVPLDARHGVRDAVGNLVVALVGAK